MRARASPQRPIFLLKPKIGQVRRKVFSPFSLQQQHRNVKDYILTVHGFNGCDTTSAIYGKGKKIF